MEENSIKKFIKKRIVQIAIIFIPAMIYCLYRSEKHEEDSIWGLYGLVTELAGALLTWLIFWFFWKKIEEDDTKERNANLISQIKETINKTIPSLRKSGISEYHSKIPDIETIINSSQKEVKILQTWIDDITPMYSTLLNVAKRGIKVKVLILKENSHQTKYRANSLSIPIEEAKASIVKTVNRVIEIANEYKNIEIKQYDDLISMSAYIIDDNCLTGWYWRGIKGKDANNRNKPYLQIHGESSELYQAVNEHFENIWQNASAV